MDEGRARGGRGKGYPVFAPAKLRSLAQMAIVFTSMKHTNATMTVQIAKPKPTKKAARMVRNSELLQRRSFKTGPPPVTFFDQQ